MQSGGAHWVPLCQPVGLWSISASSASSLRCPRTQASLSSVHKSTVHPHFSFNSVGMKLSKTCDRIEHGTGTGDRNRAQGEGTGLGTGTGHRAGDRV